MKTNGLLFLLTLLLASCDEKSAQEQGSPSGKAKSPVAELAGHDGDDEAGGGGKTKSAERPKKSGKPLMAVPAENHPGMVISPFSGDLVDVSGSEPGDVVVDPKYLGDETKKFIVPEGVEPVDQGEPPVARFVPGKPGFVISPFNDKIIDVTGLPAGTLVADPTYPGSAKKRFRVPEGEAPDPSTTFDPAVPPPVDPPAEQSEPGEKDPGSADQATPPKAEGDVADDAESR